VVVLGDNIIERNIVAAVDAFRSQKEGARILLKEVADPERFGVPTFEGKRIVRIDEKPLVPASNYAVIGIYLYDAEVFEFIKTLKPSDRGELEITDVNNFYINKGKMEWDILEGWWTDAGTFESLRAAGTFVAETGANKV
jgi:glucose-1-phosphate thymidylyltransferase